MAPQSWPQEHLRVALPQPYLCLAVGLINPDPKPGVWYPSLTFPLSLRTCPRITGLCLTLVITPGPDPGLNPFWSASSLWTHLRTRTFDCPPLPPLGLSCVGALGPAMVPCAQFLVLQERPARPTTWHFSYKFSFAFKLPEIRTNRNLWRAVQKYMSRCTSPFQPLHLLWQCNIWLSLTSLLYHHVQENEFSASLMSMFPNESFVWVSLSKCVRNNR